ncbi:oxidoreductase [Rhodococcus rhodochrous]|uniref:PDR/VanB family oxidoreductase n=1 Tax=Rhodococcus TaxID=1827 RepID=UPI000ACF0A3E|nr:oxidoreductase [Rhodococcus rhodochrous]
MSTAAPELLIRQMRWEAQDVISLLLEDPEGARLPAWEAGAHIDLVLPSGTVRQYSLCGDPADDHSYRIAVLREATGRGGSAEVHTLRPGIRVGYRPPRNLFPLVEAEHHLLVAGGIGITPLLAMARMLTARGASWSLLYGGRSRASMAFVDEVRTLGPDVVVVPQDELGHPDLAGALAAAPAGTAVYCCGPEPLLRAAEEATRAALGEEAFHYERFGAAPVDPDVAADPDEAFEVELRRSGVVLPVPAGRSLLDVVREVDPDVAFSCEDGFCGSCETKVLEGVPEHRDSVLTKAERESGTTMMICVGRSRTPRLVLDV